MEQWKTIEPGIWKPTNKGDSITGKVISKEPGNKEAKRSAKYHLDTSDGIFLVWGCAVLDERMIGIPIGSKIRITFKEQKDIGKGRTLNIYKVELAVSNGGEAA